MAEIAEIICTGVTLTSCPMATDPIELGVQFSSGAQHAAIFSRQFDSGGLADAEILRIVS